ncbi:MAG TPA: histidine phosphatase family protein [Acidimicrobiia bacterium]|nr:histidine phosphatase family protein [Acidimicrobiia bacterium]
MADKPEIVLVRHGETEWSSSGRHTSYSDIALTDRGRRQAAELGPRLLGRGFALVLTSPRSRAIETCALAGLGDRAEVTDDLAEWNYGVYEGRTTADIRRSVPNWTIFTHGAPGGECAREIAARADRVLARARDANGPVALFSHGHFLRVIGARWVGLPANGGRSLGLDVATLSVLGHEHEERVLKIWNA